jgi:hypothetical protein
MVAPGDGGEAGDGGGADDEPRARDVLERVASRALLGEVFARVGEPPWASPRTPEDEELAARVARRERALAAVDRRLVAHLERHERGAAGLVARLPPAPRLVVERELGAVDPAVFAVRDAGDEVAVERPDEITAALEQAVPQAVLRDLHRPVVHFGDIELRPRSLGIDRSGERARAELRAALAERHGGLADLPTGSQIMREELTALAATLAAPWEASRPEHPTSTARATPGAEDWRWFGLDGGYDPDQ